MGAFTIIMGIIVFILILGIIVVVHEGGHLIVAKKNGVYCHEFSIGMGPKLFQFYKDKTGTIYNLRAIPLGGYVRIAGEDTGDEADEAVPKDQRFDNKSKWIKFKILVAGAMMNFILGMVIYFIIGFFVGIPVTNMDTNQISVVSGGSVESAGLVTGDSIISINGTEVTTYNEMVEVLEDSGNTIDISYEHEGVANTTSIDKDESGKVGISPYKTEIRFHLFDSITYSVKQLVAVIIQTFYSIFLLVSGQAAASDLMGPVGIATATTGFVSLGIIWAIKWMAFLSLAIGVMNLLPIPALDGGRILFIGIEAIIGKPVNPKVETWLNNIVFFGLLALIIYVTFFDIARAGEMGNFFNGLK